MVTLPLIVLAIPSVIIGWLTVGPMLFGDFFGSAIQVHEANDVLKEMGHEFHGPLAMVLHGFAGLPFWFALAGFAVATYVYLFNPSVADKAATLFAPVVRMLQNKYWIDDLYFAVFAKGGLKLGRGLWKGGDAAVIDGVLIDGSASLVQRIALLVRRLQSGYLYHYAFAMILGLILLLGGFFLVAH